MVPQSPFESSSSSGSDRLEEARRIEVRPRSGGPSVRGDEASGLDEAMLHFSCPACLHMLGALKRAGSASIACPTCGAIVMPPQLITLGVAKTVLPPPKKSGTHALRKR